MKNLKRLKISGLVLVILLVCADIFLTIFQIYFIENEYGPNETGKYFGCGQENKWERRLCLVGSSQKEIILDIIGKGYKGSNEK